LAAVWPVVVPVSVAAGWVAQPLLAVQKLVVFVAAAEMAAPELLAAALAAQVAAPVDCPHQTPQKALKSALENSYKLFT
jgi:hypothetical protein